MVSSTLFSIPYELSDDSSASLCISSDTTTKPFPISPVLADSYDAMTSDRPYRKGPTHTVAVDELIKFKEIQFDPKIVDAFF